MRNSVVDLGLCLLAAHLLGDFVLQTSQTAAKKKRLRVLIQHVLLHAVLAYALVGWWTEWRLAALVALAHGLIDFVKSRVAGAKAGVFLADQTAHLATLALLAWIWGKGGEGSYWAEICGRRFDRVLIVAAGGIVSVRSAAILIGFWVQPYLDEIRKVTKADEIAESRVRGLTNGGRVIGQWERALIFLFIGMGQPGAVGFLIAAKSIFRFGELKDYENRMEAEYITIGTLMSFGLAAAVAFGTFWLERRW